MSERASDGDGASGEDERARLFVALDLPDAPLAAIAAWQAAEARRRGGAPGLRAVPPDSLHVTLAFLGERPVTDLEAIVAVLEGLEPGPIEAELLPEPVPVPRRRPHLFALELCSPGAISLQGALASGLREIGVYRLERRPFWPHLTVFRVPGRRSRAAAGARRVRLQPLGDGSGHAFGFVRVALYRSNLRPEGASYSRLAANELPQQGGRQKR